MKKAADLFLAVGERLYCAGLWVIQLGFRRGFLKKHRLPVPVISVGNLTWGGTGKTPLVIYLAQALQGEGRSVAVLTRGYGGDETALLMERLHPIPVLVGADRVASGNRAVQEYGADLLLLDDGYQQWRLKKDVEILAVSAGAPFGNGHLIPRGILREPVNTAARADLIVVKQTGAQPGRAQSVKTQLKQFNPAAPVFFMSYEPERLWRWPGKEKVALKSLKGQKVCTLAGIGDPKQFETTVESLGAKLSIRYRARDHHPYTAGELIRLLTRCHRHGIRKVVTTAKDAVRIPKLLEETVGKDLKGTEFLVLEIKPRFEPNEIELLYRIRSVLAR